MPISFMYDLNLIAGVSSPSTRHNIVSSGRDEYAEVNYQIASKRQLRPLNTYIDTSDTDNHIQHITNYQHNIYTKPAQQEAKEYLRKRQQRPSLQHDRRIEPPHQQSSSTSRLKPE